MDTDSNAAFVRQRRNLLLSSIALSLLTYSGASIDQINILGNKMTNINNDDVIILLVALNIYFFIRYLQSYNDLKLYIIFTLIDEIKSKIRNHIQEHRCDEIAKQLKIENTKTVYIKQITFHSASIRSAQGTVKARAENNSSDHSINIDINITEIAVMLILYYLRKSVTTKLFTEYHFPIIFSLVSFCYGVYNFENTNIAT